MPAVLAVGDLMVEVCLVVDDASSTSPDAQVHECVLSCGGSAANFACCGAALGMDVLLDSRIGDDFFSTMLLRDLHDYGVDVGRVRHTPGPTPVCVVVIGEDGDRRFMSYRGGSEPLLGCDGPTSFDGIDWLHVSGFAFQDPASAARAGSLIRSANAAGVRVSIDPSPLMVDYVREDLAGLLSSIDCIFPNEFEALQLTGCADIPSAARSLAGFGIAFVVVTRGPAGVLVLANDRVVNLPAKVGIEARDSTGAGDAFAAGFIDAIRRGDDSTAAAKAGSALAARIVACVGGHTGASGLREGS